MSSLPAIVSLDTRNLEDSTVRVCLTDGSRWMTGAGGGGGWLVVVGGLVLQDDYR